MARNSAGTYTVPAATNPVVPGTNISTTWANGTLGDLASEMTDSLSRSGKGGMTAPLRTADGAVAAPAHSYTSETGTGWYRSAAGVVRLAILGVYRLLVNATGAIVNGTLGVQDPTGGKTTTLASPSGLAADQTITFPAALPGSTLPVQMSATGGLSAAVLTRPQLPAVGQQVSASTGAFSGSATSATDVTNATVTITVTGRPVILVLQAVSSSYGYISLQADAGSTRELYVDFFRGATWIAETGFKSPASALTLGPNPLFVDIPAAGTYTYKIQYWVSNASATAGFYYLNLVAYEL